MNINSKKTVTFATKIPDKFMTKKIKSLFSFPVSAILLMGVLYVLFPSINPSGDSYTYAYQIKSGNDLFLSHHLLYNAFFFVLTKMFFIEDVLGFVSLMNGLFAVGCLFFTHSIISRYTTKRIQFF
jgi:hypothetical protein